MQTENLNITTGFKELTDFYLDRILNFYEYDTELEVNLSAALRHIEIVRVQISNDRKLYNISQYESDLLDSVITDSYFFEKCNEEEENKWKIHFIRLTWNRLLEYLGIKLDPKKISILKNVYVDTRHRPIGRTYRKYEGRHSGKV